MLIHVCAVIDDIFDRARGGDPAAFAAIKRMMPPALPPAERIRWRNDRLRAIATRMRADQVNLSARGMARLLAAAGERLRSPNGRLPDTAPFHRLAVDERDGLAIEIREVLSLLGDEKWPTESRMRQIINDIGG